MAAAVKVLTRDSDSLVVQPADRPFVINTDDHGGYALMRRLRHDDPPGALRLIGGSLLVVLGVGKTWN